MKVLKPHLALTLAAISAKAYRSTRQIWQRRPVSDLDATQRAISNRLQELKAKRLVVCYRVGKDKFWRRA